MLLIALKVDEGSPVQSTALIMAGAGACITGEGFTDAAAAQQDAEPPEDRNITTILR